MANDHRKVRTTSIESKVAPVVVPPAQIKAPTEQAIAAYMGVVRNNRLVGKDEAAHRPD